MQADRPSSRLSAAPPAQDQAGTPRNRQSRSAARVHPPWLRVPSGAHPHRRTPSDLASPNPRFATPKGIIIARKQRGSWRRPVVCGGPKNSRLVLLVDFAQPGVGQVGARGGRTRRKTEGKGFQPQPAVLNHPAALKEHVDPSFLDIIPFKSASAAL